MTSEACYDFRLTYSPWIISVFTVCSKCCNSTGRHHGVTTAATIPISVPSGFSTKYIFNNYRPYFSQIWKWFFFQSLSSAFEKKINWKPNRYKKRPWLNNNNSVKEPPKYWGTPKSLNVLELRIKDEYWLTEKGMRHGGNGVFVISIYTLGSVTITNYLPMRHVITP